MAQIKCEACNGVGSVPLVGDLRWIYDHLTREFVSVATLERCCLETGRKIQYLLDQLKAHGLVEDRAHNGTVVWRRT